MLPLHAEPISDRASHPRPELTRTRRVLLEQTELMTLGERIRILAMLCGRRWFTDVGLGLDASQEFSEYASKIESLLRDLGLVSAPFEKPSRKGDTVRWLGVAATPEILEFVARRAESLSVIEAGVLYGYPHSHILGFAELIRSDKRQQGSKKKTCEEHYLAGVFSRDFRTQEEAYFAQLWEDLRAVSPALIEQAEAMYQKG